MTAKRWRPAKKRLRRWLRERRKRERRALDAHNEATTMSDALPYTPREYAVRIEVMR